MSSRLVSPFLRLVVFASGLAGLAALEAFLPFRVPCEPRGPRWRVNLTLGLLDALTAGLFGLVRPGGCGVPIRFFGGDPGGHRLAAPLRIALAVVTLDFLSWAWHVACHRITWLWRFHAVHHSETELDVTTSARFHLGELL